MESSERLLMRQDLISLDGLQPLIAEVESELARLSTVEPWASQAPFLIQLPGIGLLNAMVLLSAIGDSSRLPTAKQLVGYSGLGVSVHASGQGYRTGRITKQGRRELRWAMVEAAWRAVESFPKWKAEFAHLEHRLGSKQAIVAIARKHLVVVWHVLTEHVADRYADPERVALKLMAWSSQVGSAGRQGAKPAVFIRRQLTTLGLGASLAASSRGGRCLKIPPASTGTRTPGSWLQARPAPDVNRRDPKHWRVAPNQPNTTCSLTAASRCLPWSGRFLRHFCLSTLRSFESSPASGPLDKHTHRWRDLLLNAVWGI